MALSYRTRKRLSLLVLLLGLPGYIAVALVVISLFERPPLLLELAVYVILGVLWAIPLKRVFLGIGQPDPDKPGADTARDPEKPGADTAPGQDTTTTRRED